MSSIVNTAYAYPFGVLHIETNKDDLTRLWSVETETEVPENLKTARTDYTDEIFRQVTEYLEGTRTQFELNYEIRSTEFQHKVWKELKEIPYGKTISYGTLAAKIGNPKAARAVGMAVNKNPLLLIIPCHRVIGSNGSLTGYAGGLSMKQALLTLEKNHLTRDLS